MTDSSRKTPTASKLSARTSMILVGLVIAYVLLQPSLERWLGIELPSLIDASGEVADHPPRQPKEAEPPNDDVRSAETSTGELGQLHEIGGRVFVSTAGLHYRPGSQEGHRIDHILRHCRDDRSRPVHGIFDGDREEILAIIDEAYLTTQERGPPEAHNKREENRTVWTVDLGRRIGYVGGQSGERSNHPPAHHLKLILEDGNNVVSAYPVRISGR
ncbi:MAG: hypothetical protein KDA93_20750 [Planctomycetaceae bacterium]|nr:hypothetical protein [Planctomycetaceae bacterium]